MAKKQNSNTSLQADFKGFKGIDTRTTHSGKESILDMNNFNLLPNGSLKRRPGYKTLFSSDKTIRAVWSGIVNGEELCYFVANQQLYQFYSDMSVTRIIGNILTSSGYVEFFHYHDSLYLIDGAFIYKVSNGSASLVQGYVPLFGKDWDTGVVGEINEPINMLNRNARITYKAGENPTAYLATMYPVQSVEALYKNGSYVSSSSYTIDKRFNTVNLPGIESGDVIELALTFEKSDIINTDVITKCTSAMVFGGITDSRLFMWDGTDKTVMFVNTPVSKESVAAAERRYANCGELYFPIGNSFIAGNGNYPIQAVMRHYDRMLVLTTQDAWMANSSNCDTENIPTMNINTLIGCSVKNGAVTIGNDPISIGNNAIYQWTRETDELNEANAYSISDQIADYLPPTFFKNATVFADTDRYQVWFSERNGDGDAWIYDIKQRAWFKYTNINAKMFFKWGKNIGFATENSVRLFSDDLMEDINEVDSTVGTPIEASLTSGIIDFDTIRDKKLSSVSIFGDISDSQNSIILNCDQGESIPISFDEENKTHSVLTRRVFSHRFKSLYCTLLSSGQSKQTIHGIKIRAR